MAFMKYARAAVVTPHISPISWGNIRDSGKGNLRVARKASPSENLIERASELVGRQFNPKDFLLTHATIVASVDVFSPPGIKTGAVVEDGFRINRKFSDFRVKLESDKYINNNLDGWSRGVLAKAFPTFIGGHNFVEHVQVEDLSKGRIIDAVARDIGDSLYVDILIATDRKHKDLVTAIENGKMGTLSMGCTVDGTQCTQCGHWAADETEMCPHIKYAKGNTFFDDEGRKHRVAELCGHESIDPTGGVTFIEASWVGTPAFTGAVLRNIVEANPSISVQAAKVLNELPPEWNGEAPMKVAKQMAAYGADGIRRVAFDIAKPPVNNALDSFLAGFTADDGDQELEAPPPAPPAAPEKKPEEPFKDIEDDLYKTVKDRVMDRIKKEMNPTPGPEQSSSENENLQKLATVYKAGLATLIRTAASDPALMDSVASFNASVGVNIPVPIYRAALKVGPHSQFKSAKAFQKACKVALGREPNHEEVKTVLRLSQLLSLKTHR